MKDPIVDKKHYRTDTFYYTDEFPIGYEVWAIGRANFQYPKCIPLAVIGADRHLDLPKSLKYMELESEELAAHIMREASLHGVDEVKFHKLVKEFVPESQADKTIKALEAHLPTPIKVKVSCHNGTIDADFETTVVGWVGHQVRIYNPEVNHEQWFDLDSPGCSIEIL